MKPIDPMPWVIAGFCLCMAIWATCESSQASYDPGMFADPCYWHSVDSAYCDGENTLHYRVNYMSLQTGDVHCDSSVWMETVIQ